MTEDKRISLQKYAMQFGTMMGVFWIVKFIFFPLGLKYTFFQFIFIILTIAVPFLGYKYTCTFRNKILGGNINFSQAWIFSLFMYIFASILVAVAHYIYFRFLDHGFILDRYMASLHEISSLQVEGIAESVKMLEENLDLIRSLSPIQLTFQLFNLNVFAATFLSVITALFTMRNRDNNFSNTFKRS